MNRVSVISLARFARWICSMFMTTVAGVLRPGYCYRQRAETSSILRKASLTGWREYYGKFKGRSAQASEMSDGIVVVGVIHFDSDLSVSLRSER
jgi:hypothetical protein